MAKRTNQASLKGELDIDFDKLILVVEEAGYVLEDLMKIEITEIVKEAEYTYDVVELLKEFDGKTISFTVKEEQELEPVND